ncbi:MAG: STAS domain-containing protein [Aeromonas sp.]
MLQLKIALHLTYFNAPYFKRRVLAQLVTAPHSPRSVVIDAVACFTHQDISVMSMLGDLDKTLRRRGVHLLLAGRQGQLGRWLKQAGIRCGEQGVRLSPDLYQALQLARELGEPRFMDEAPPAASDAPAWPASASASGPLPSADAELAFTAPCEQEVHSNWPRY